MRMDVWMYMQRRVLCEIAGGIGKRKYVYLK